MRFRTPAIVLLDVVVACAVALHVWRQYAGWTTLDIDPPRCENYYGDEVSCSTGDLVPFLAAVAVLGVLLFGSLWFQRRRGWI